MGRVGACGDNAAMESFFALVQKNVLDRQRWSTREQLRLAIVTWIEKTYHRKRRQRRLGKLTPNEFETTNRTAHAACTTQPHESTQAGQYPLLRLRSEPIRIERNMGWHVETWTKDIETQLAS